MSSGRIKRAKLAVVAGAGAVAIAVAGLFVAWDWPGILCRWHAWRLGKAETLEAAAPHLEALGALASRPGASDALFDLLGRSRARCTLWVFASLEEEQPATEPLARRFLARLERDERLLALWSHFVRWRVGPEIVEHLDALSPGLQEAGESRFPCVPIHPATEYIERLEVNGTGVLPIINPAIVLSRDSMEPDSMHRPLGLLLRDLAIGWFLGVPAAPAPGADHTARLRAWLYDLAPFRRQPSYDAALERCKRDGEAEPIPALTSFAERGLPVPGVPLPGWRGLVSRLNVPMSRPPFLWSRDIRGGPVTLSIEPLDAPEAPR